MITCTMQRAMLSRARLTYIAVCVVAGAVLAALPFGGAK